jgi:hypothetical protein
VSESFFTTLKQKREYFLLYKAKDVSEQEARKSDPGDLSIVQIVKQQGGLRPSGRHYTLHTAFFFAALALLEDHIGPASRHTGPGAQAAEP